jgi:hypothetical protein
MSTKHIYSNKNSLPTWAKECEICKIKGNILFDIAVKFARDNGLWDEYKFMESFEFIDKFAPCNEMIMRSVIL